MKCNLCEPLRNTSAFQNLTDWVVLLCLFGGPPGWLFLAISYFEHCNSVQIYLAERQRIHESHISKLKEVFNA